MALKDQMDNMLSPEDEMLQQDTKPATEEDIKAGKQLAKEIVFESFPGVGEAASIARVKKELEEDDYVGAGIEGVAGAIGLLPFAGDIAGKGFRQAAKAFRKTDVAEAEKLLDNPEQLDLWREQNKLPESQRQVNPEISKQAAADLYEGKITSKEARQKIKEAIPEPELYTPETMPDMPSVTEVTGSLGKKAGKYGILGVKGFDLPAGKRVSSRLDIPAYNDYNTWVVSIHDGKSASGAVEGFGQAIRLKNIRFGSDSEEALNIARGQRTVKKTGEDKPMGKATIARVFGDYVPEDPYVLQEEARRLLADPNSGWTQVGMNPYRKSAFYDKATGNPVFEADEVIQVGPLVLAKNVKKPTKQQLRELAVKTRDGKIRMFNEGGVAIDKQMKMLGDVELRSDLEPFISKDPLARLGYELYRRNIINVDALVLDQGRALGNASENTITQGVFSPSGETSFNKYLAKQKNIDENIEKPRVVYSAGRDESFRPRGRSMNTLAHELRHAAIYYLENEKGYKLPLENEEDLTSYLDAARVKDKNYFTKDIEADITDKKAYEQKDKIEPVYEEVSSIANAELKNLQVPKEQQQKKKEKSFLRELFNFNEGGVAMDKQMELFEDGGLKDEGGMVDEMSGNEVPPGSTREEVRDDIPAQLSEGEFVFPADVVRYIGLENLMRMRQEAKMGLAQMEAMGQMGNSEEATMPDDLPFDMYDLDMEDDGVVEYAQGGVVQAAQGMYVPPQIGNTNIPQPQYGIVGYQPSQFASYGQQPMQPSQPFQPSAPVGSYTPPTQQYTPTIGGQTPTTFTGFTGMAAPGTGGYDEMKTYVNDAGMTMQIPFKDGNPIYPIPEGYRLQTEAVQTAQTTTTTGTGTETAQVTPDSGDDDQPGPTTGSVVSVGGEAYGPEEGGGIPGIAPGPSRRVRGATQFGLETVKEGGIGEDFPIPGIITGLLSAATGTTVGYNYVDQKTGNKVFQTEEQHKANKEGLGKGGIPEVVTLAAEINRVATDNFKDKVSQQIEDLSREQGIKKSKAREIIRNELMEANGIDPKVGKFMSDAQIVAQGNINRAKEAAAKYGIDTSNKSVEQINAEVKAEQDRRIAAAEARASAYGQQMGGTGEDSSYDTNTYSGSYAAGVESYGIPGLAKGGLVEQMEKSGLTPKK